LQLFDAGYGVGLTVQQHDGCVEGTEQQEEEQTSAHGEQYDPLSRCHIAYRVRYYVTGAVQLVDHVCGPTRPSTDKPFSCWNCLAILEEVGPNIPSTDPMFQPLAAICRCHVATFVLSTPP